MEKFLQDLTVGVIAGIATAFGLWFFNLLWTMYFKQRVQNWFYKETRIDQTQWIARTTIGNMDREVSWKFIQRAQHVYGVATALSGPNKGKRFIARGSIRNSILTLNYWTKNNRYLDRGSLAMRLIGNGLRMEGFLACYDQSTEKLASVVYTMVSEGDPISDSKTEAVPTS